MGKQAVRKIKKNLDKAYKKKLRKRAKNRILERVQASEPAERQPPYFPEWAIKSVAALYEHFINISFLITTTTV